MIIQGSNLPIITELDSEINPVKLEMSLYLKNGDELKHWTIDDVTITTSENKSTISAPLTEDETLAFPKGNAILELKYRDNEGRNEFCDKKIIRIVYRNDKTKMG